MSKEHIGEPMLSTYLTTKETAAKLRLKEVTIRRWIGSGKLKAQRAGKHYLVPIEEIERVLGGAR